MKNKMQFCHLAFKINQILSINLRKITYKKIKMMTTNKILRHL